jgi:putative flippase GtrA
MTSIETIFRKKTDSFFIQLFRYTFVGGTAFIVDFSSLFILTEFFGLYYLVSATLAFILGLTTNYTLSVVWVFNKRRLKTRWLEFTINASIAGTGLLLNILIIWFFTEKIHFYYLLSKVTSTGIVFWWNFLIKKIILFSK